MGYIKDDRILIFGELGANVMEFLISKIFN